MTSLIGYSSGENVTSSWLSAANGNVTSFDMTSSPVAMTTAADSHGSVGTQIHNALQIMR